MRSEIAFSAFALAALSLALHVPLNAGPLCEDNIVTASGIRTREDLKSFVHCAAEYVSEHGTAEARRGFNDDARWGTGPIYIFVDSLARSGDKALNYVFPPDPSTEGEFVGPLVDRFGTDFFFEAHRIVLDHGSGWIQYEVRNWHTGQIGLKRSYITLIDWDGQPAVLGAGLYERDLPGSCDDATINAAALDASPSDEMLKEFVRCAAAKVESMGYFAAPVLARDPRWRAGSVYVFGVNPITQKIEFSGSASSSAASGRIRDLFDGRDAVGVGSAFGEAYLYFDFPNPATGMVEPKVAFVKRVLAQGEPMLVGSGYYVPDN